MLMDIFGSSDPNYGQLAICNKENKIIPKIIKAKHRLMTYLKSQIILSTSKGIFHGSFLNFSFLPAYQMHSAYQSRDYIATFNGHDGNICLLIGVMSIFVNET
jgi:hypothetical protein